MDEVLSKEQGFVLSIDQASNAAGVSLWNTGQLTAHTVLRSTRAVDPLSVRLQTQLPQLTAFLNEHLPANGLISKVIFEGVKARLVMSTVGAFLVCPRIAAKLHDKHTFVESRQWKKYAADRGAAGPFKDIKGVKALREIGFEVDRYGIDSDDVADSVLIYLTWRSRK